MAKKAHEPTEQTRDLVEKLSAAGVRYEDIAVYLGITRPTLDKYYSEELKTGTIKANVKVAQTLYQQAMAGSTTAAIFWLKTRAGWREVQRLEMSGADGQPIQVNNGYDLSKLSKEKLLQLREILVEANAGANPDITGN